MIFLRNTWYVAAAREEVTRVPMSRTLLGEPVLLYRTEGGEAVALSDKCPHRFAPLHLGKVVGDIITCPYHGLGFDPHGRCVLNPHSDVIPPNARLKRYAAVERHALIWLWWGEGEPQLEKLPDYPELEHGETQRTIGGLLKVRANYFLVADNLLDLTHSGYLHASTVSVPASVALPESTSGVDEEGVFAKFITAHVHAPGHWRQTWGERLCDYHRLVHWAAPGRVTTRIGCAPVDQPIDKGTSTIARHLLTPQDNSSTHYFWRHTRTYNLDPAGDEHIRKFIETAFIHEDEPMIAACQDYMGTEDLLSLKPVLLPTDRASILARRRLAKLKREEDEAGSQDMRGASPATSRSRAIDTEGTST